MESAAVPLIYTRDSAPPGMGTFSRLIAAGVAVLCLAVLVTGSFHTVGDVMLELGIADFEE